MYGSAVAFLFTLRFPAGRVKTRPYDADRPIAVGAPMAQATFSLVFDQIHLVRRPPLRTGIHRAAISRPYRTKRSAPSS